jgi:hypothetical protein
LNRFWLDSFACSIKGLTDGDEETVALEDGTHGRSDSEFVVNLVSWSDRRLDAEVNLFIPIKTVENTKFLRRMKQSEKEIHVFMSRCSVLTIRLGT